MDLRLYEIAENIDAALMADEFEPSVIDGLVTSMEDKAKAIIAVSGKIGSFVDLCKSEEKRISQLRKFAENRDVRLKSYLKDCMELAGMVELPVGTMTAKIQKNPPKVIIDNEEDLPAKYIRVVQTNSVDKAGLKIALKSGDVKGCHLDQSSSLRIK